MTLSISFTIWKIRRLNRYVGDYDHFQEVYEVKKSQLEAAYRRQQQEISELKDFVARNKARVVHQKYGNVPPEKAGQNGRHRAGCRAAKAGVSFQTTDARQARYIFETKDLVIGYDEPLSKPLNLSMERGQKIALVGANGIGKTTLLKSILGSDPIT